MLTRDSELSTPHRTALSLAVGMAKLMRPHQWIKNAFVFAPLIFSRSFFDWHSDLQSLIAFALFCVASSAGYVVNDLRDIDQDRIHPVKRFRRPLASGAIDRGHALGVLGVLIAVLVTICIVFPVLIAAVATYLALTFSYSWKLKRIPVVDLFAIALGFVLRVYLGAVAIGVVLSGWMFVTTLSLALYLAAMKRRQELINSGSAARDVLLSYSIPLLNYYATASSVSAVVFYGLYITTVNPLLMYTVVFVLAGLFRYQFLADTVNEGESPTDLVLKDRVLGITVVIWAASAVYVLSGKN